MKLFKMRFVPLLVLILCTVVLLSIPTGAAGATTTTLDRLEGFAYNDMFTLTYTKYVPLGANDQCSATVTVGNTNKIIKTAARGYKEDTFDDCGNDTGDIFYASTTTLKLTAKQNILVTYTDAGISGISGFHPFGTVTSNSDGSKSFAMPQGASVEFSVTSNNQNEKSGTFTFTDVKAVDDVSVPADCATYLYNTRSFPEKSIITLPYLDCEIKLSCFSAVIPVNGWNQCV